MNEKGVGSSCSVDKDMIYVWLYVDKPKYSIIYG